MNFFVIFAAVLVVSATALDTAEFTFGNSKLQKFQKAVAAQVSSATESISQALYNEFDYLQGLHDYSMQTIFNVIGDAQLTADYNALINSIVAKLSANFDPATVAASILAPYQAVFSQWYARVSSDVASLNTANPPVKLACLKAVESSITGNITDLSSRVTNKVNQQLSVINPRFKPMNIAINADLAHVDMGVADACENDFTCAIAAYQNSLPTISAIADKYIQQNVDAFASDVATAATKAGELNDIFVKRYTWIGQDLAKCAAAAASA